MVYREASRWAVSSLFLKNLVLVETKMIPKFASDPAPRPPSEIKFGRKTTMFSK